MEIPGALVESTIGGRCLDLGGGPRVTMIRSLDPLPSSFANSANRHACLHLGLTALSSINLGYIDQARGFSQPVLHQHYY